MRKRTNTIEMSELRRKELGAWLREHREVLDITQAEAGRRAGMSRTQYTRIEMGESGTRRDRIPALASAVEADEAATYRLAGFATETESERPAFIEYFNELPPQIQEFVEAGVAGFWRKFKKQRAKNAAGTTSKATPIRRKGKS